MPHFTLTLTQQAPIVVMMVGVSQARHTALTDLNQPIPQPQNIRALIDTGASHTCVDPMVFQALALQPTGSTPMLTPSTGPIPVDADTYDVSIMIPNGPHPGLIIPNMAVSASELFTAQGFHALLGRDILSRCVLTYNGSVELFTLAY
jgi:hypothetical protein